MGRHKIKNADPKTATEELVAEAVINFGEAYDDRKGRRPELPTLRSVADEMGTTILRVRKLLITGNFFSTSLSRSVQELAAAGKSVDEIMAKHRLSRASVYSYLPYKNVAFNLPKEKRSRNADRQRVFRTRKKALATLQGDPSSINLWKAIVAFSGYTFETFGRGSKSGVTFKYSVPTDPGKSGQKYKGESVDGWGNELFIVCGGEKRDKSITRSSVDYALKIAIENEVTGPKALKIFGSSYVYAIFKRFGLV